MALRVGCTHLPDRKTDWPSFPLSGRSMKLAPGKDGATSEAQTGAALDEPEWAGQPAAEDSMRNGRVTASCSFPSASTVMALTSPRHPLGLKTSHPIDTALGRSRETPLY